MGLRG